MYKIKIKKKIKISSGSCIGDMLNYLESKDKKKKEQEAETLLKKKRKRKKKKL